MDDGSKRSRKDDMDNAIFNENNFPRRNGTSSSKLIESPPGITANSKWDKTIGHNDNSNPKEQLEDERPTHYNHHPNHDTTYDDNRCNSLHDDDGDEEKEVESAVAIEENSDSEEQPGVEQPRTPPRPQRPLNPPPPPRRSQRPRKNCYFDDSIYGWRPIVEIEKSIPKIKTKKSHNTKTQLRVESPAQEMSLANSDAGRESDSSKEAFDDAQEGHKIGRASCRERV